jgi:lipopolysaccharide transport system permease protein
MQSLVSYFKKIWACRYFWLSLVRVDLRARYRGSAFGIGWSLLQPIAMTTILCVVFCTMFHQDLVEFAPYLMAGLTFWQFLMTTSLQGCECFFTGEGYIRQHPAPMAIYPLRTMLGAAFHFTLGFLLVLGLTSFCHGIGFVSALAFLSLIPTLLLLLVFGWSLAILFGLATVRFRDLKHISEVGFQGMFYLTPIMIPEKMVHDLMARRTVGWLFRLNPLVPFLDLLRAPVVLGQAPAPGAYMAALLITLFTVCAATLALRSQERKVIFYL